MNAQSIFPGMDIFDSIGNHLATVEGIKGDALEVTTDYTLRVRAHHIPLAWVKRIDSAVYLDRDYFAFRLSMHCLVTN